MTAVTTMNYSLGGYNGENVPTWANFDNEAEKISGTTPSVKEDTIYYMTVLSEFDENINGNITQYVAVQVIADKKETAEEETEAATIITQITAATVTVFSIGSSLAAGKPSTGLWSFLEQQQIIILLCSIDSFIPLRIQKYLEGISFVMLNSINIRKLIFFINFS